jgi:type I restriction enzyme S subunit
MIHDWTKVRLKDVCSRITVGHVGSMANCYVESGVPFLRSQNILPFKLHMQDVKYVSKEFHESLRKSVLRAGDVAIVRTGYPGTACVIPEGMGEVNCADLVVITPSENLNPYFLAAIFNSSWGKASVAGSLVGVAQQHFNVGAAKEMEISLPPRAIQNRIAAILSAYDDLIENNTRRIAVLEEMARRIYEEWFVHFRYPGHEQDQKVETELGLVPEGWEVRTVGECVSRLKPKVIYKKNTVEAVGQVIVVDQSELELLGFHNSGADFQASDASPMFIFGDHTCKLMLMTEPFSIGPNTVPFSSVSNIPAHFLFSALKGLVHTQEYKRHWTEFCDKKILTPNEGLMARFSETVCSMRAMQRLMQRKNRNLRQTRDLLLPRLISGELDASKLVLPDVN